MNITAMSIKYLTQAVVISIRYIAVRKQFGPSSEEEWPIIEYQVQVRLQSECLKIKKKKVVLFSTMVSNSNYEPCLGNMLYNF